MPDTMTIHYTRRLSDGAYGSEEVSMGYTVTLHSDELPEEMLNDGQTRLMYLTLRGAVLSYLAMSEAPRVAAVAAAELNSKAPVKLASNDDEDQEELPF